jgi:RHS repeat-associated protein
VATFTYSSFGTLVARTGQVSLIYGFTGQETDAESDLMYYDARYYTPGLGRFVSEDPIGFAALDTNLYRYTANNPINYVDPMGLEGGSWQSLGGANLWSWPGFRMVPNLLAGNSDIYFWGKEMDLKDQQRKLWEKGRERGSGDWRYDIYYERYYRKPVPKSVGSTIESAELTVAASYGEVFAFTTPTTIAGQSTIRLSSRGNTATENMIMEWVTLQ